MPKKDNQKLSIWQERLARNMAAYDGEEARMDEREALYRGSRKIEPLVVGARKWKTPHIRNLCAELIESQVDSNIPQPKVTPYRREDEWRAKIIEDMLRNELDRLPFEQINDMMERTVPIQGGGAFFVEWDNEQRTHGSIGELTVSAIHPKQIVPQDGVYTGIADMDYLILKIPQTKETIRKKYGVDVSDEPEQEPDVKQSGGSDTADDMVTQYIAYYRNPNGGIGLYSWVNDTELCDMEDYQARRLRRCAGCGAVEPPEGEQDGERYCPVCGGKTWRESTEEYEEVYVPIARSDGTQIPGAARTAVMDPGQIDEMGLPVIVTVETPTKIPYYKPNIYPVILQKNVSVYGRFLGDSDIDKIRDQQNTTNRIEAKILDKLLKSGSYITLPDEASIKVDESDMKVIRPGNAASKSLIDVYDLQGNIEQDMAYLAQVYEEARQAIGITDSFQGRRDSTATSGKAKEFSAAQSAGRLESKRVMKDAAYAALFEAMFKFRLAYADEPRPVVSHDTHGNTEYRAFNRYDFLDRDEAGEWHWNDRFLFSCDTSAPLASNREAMWQETRMNLQTGAFGDPASLQTLVLFWTKMEMLHYPGAGETKSYLEEELRRQAQQQQAMMQMQLAVQRQQAQMQERAQEAEIAGNVINQARNDARDQIQRAAQ